MNNFDQIELVWVKSGERVWVSLREVKTMISECMMGRIKDGWYHQGWVTMQSEFFLCKMAESMMAEFKMECHHQVEWEWLSKVFLCKMAVWIQDGRIQDGCHHQVESECMSEDHFCAKWLNPWWQNSGWLPSSCSVRMNEFESDWIRLSQSFVQHDWIYDGRIQDGCHHLVNQIELVWVRVRVELDCFLVNLREDNKVSECKMAVYESMMAEFKMASSSWVRMIK